MTETDRALRALTLKIIDELRPLAADWRSRLVPPRGSMLTRQEHQKVYGEELDAVLRRFIPRLPADLPDTSVMDPLWAHHHGAKAAAMGPDVIADPATLDAYDPRLDPLLVYYTLSFVRGLPLPFDNGTFTDAIIRHYRDSRKTAASQSEAPACT